MDHDCNIFFGLSPEGEGSAVRASAAQFDFFYEANAAVKRHLRRPQVECLSITVQDTKE